MAGTAGSSVLFICTHNAARSLMAEAILNKRLSGVRAYSAGSRPRGAPHPLTLELLRSFGHDVTFVRSKSWDEFARPGAPRIDYVIAVCNRAAGESCPHWPGRPMTANWSVDDPSEDSGGAVARRVAFLRVYRQLEQRIDAFIAEGFAAPDEMAARERSVAQDRLDLIGEMMQRPDPDSLSWPN